MLSTDNIEFALRKTFSKQQIVPNTCSTRLTAPRGRCKRLKETRKKSTWRRHLRFRKRRRGTAIVETPKGILLVSEGGKKYDLPGGATKGRENEKDTALRELEEETGLKGTECIHLFELSGRIQRDIKGGFFKDEHKVFLVKACGDPKPQSEIHYITYTGDTCAVLSTNTKRIIEKYLHDRGNV